MSRSARALLYAVRAYQAFFSVLMPSACKFYPSCSHFAAEAVRVHGARRGSWLALRRVARCHPFTRGGVDLVPDAGEFSSETCGVGSALPEFFAGASEKRQAEARPTGSEGAHS